MTFQDAVQETPAFQGRWRQGLRALRGRDRPHVQAEDTRRLTGSVYADTALEGDFPNDQRWDYAIGHRPTDLRQEMVYWVEVHPASDGEVNVVLGKLRWLQQCLHDSAPQLNAMWRQFIWVSSGKTSFTLSSPQQKQFALLGLQHKGRVLRIPNEATS